MTNFSEATKKAFWANPDDERHGTAYAYNSLSCRCVHCKDAKAAYLRGKGRDISHSTHLADVYPVKSSDPDPKLWHWTGQEWLPRWGEEMLGSEF